MNIFYDFGLNTFQISLFLLPILAILAGIIGTLFTKKHIIGAILAFPLSLFLFGDIAVLYNNILSAIAYGFAYATVGFVSGDLTKLILK